MSLRLPSSGYWLSLLPGNLIQQRSWTRIGFERAVLSRSMTLVDLWIIEHRFWRFLSWRDLAQCFLVFLEQCKYHANNLTSNTSHHLSPASIVLRSFVKTTLNRDQAFVELGPF